MTSKLRRKSGLLKGGQSITGVSRTPKSLKPQQSRQLIRRFHVLQKFKSSILTRLSRQFGQELTLDNYKQVLQGYKDYDQEYTVKFEQALRQLKKSDKEVYRIDELPQSKLIEVLAKIDAEVDIRGGIQAYQSASTQGQDSKRGGDSSKKLIEWLNSEKYNHNLSNINALEIGCLSSNNLISTSGIFTEIVRIDLNSQSPAILQQNFMERPLPKNENEKFNVISCSLVINFVPSPKERGDMLIRITKFLKKPTPGSVSAVFIVLPLPCVSNSRYFDNNLFQKMMKNLGFEQTFYYEAKKVAYWLFDWSGNVKIIKTSKRELHSGSTRNNFCITIE